MQNWHDNVLRLIAEIDRCIRDLHADGAQSDNTKLFAADLMTGKFLFRLLHIFGDIFIVLLLLAPVDAADYVSGSQQHASQHQLFDTVCIGARCIEYDNTSLRNKTHNSQ